MKKYFWIGIILAVSIGLRVIFSQYFTSYRVLPDSVSYFETGIRMVKTHTYVDAWRTPVYPVFLMLPYELSGTPLPDTYQGSRVDMLTDIREIQQGMGIASLLLLYSLLSFMGLKKWIAGMYCVLLSANWMLLSLEYAILTEAFSIFWLLIVMNIFARLMKRISVVRMIVITVCFVLGVLLRPSYILFPVALLLILLATHRAGKTVLYGFISLAVYACCLAGYSYANFMTTGYKGISHISAVNLLGKVLEYRLPMDDVVDPGGVKNTVASYVARNGYPDEPWYILGENPRLYETKNLEKLADFAGNVLIRHASTYMLRAFIGLPKAMLDISAVTDLPAPVAPGNSFMAVLQWVSKMALPFNLILFIVVPVGIVRLFLRTSFLERMMTVCGIVALYHLAFGVFFGYNDFGRHMVVALPIAYAASLYGWYRIGNLALSKWWYTHRE